MDNDPGPGTDYLVFDPISQGTVIPYTIPAGPIDLWDHDMGDNTFTGDDGVVASSPAEYATFLSTYNVLQNSWRPTFYQNADPYMWDPDVPGRYEYYLAAFSGGTEVARTAITIVVVDGMTLSLEADPCQQDQDAVTPGTQIAVELWLRNPDGDPVTGYQTFLAYDDMAMTYEGTASSYHAGSFEAHVVPAALAEVAAGELRFDGNTFSSPAGVTGDELLATLVFTVSECDLNTVAFDLTQAFGSETSFFGTPYTTSLLDSPSVIGDVTPPVLIGTPADITQAADAGSCTEAVVTWVDPTASDACDASPTVVCSPSSGSTFPVGTTTVTCTATDDCGNVSTETFDVTVTATNLVDVVVELTGSVATSRCIHFVLDGCGDTVDETLVFSGSVPATAVATIEVPCGVWTSLSAKDEQHTKWDDAALVVSGAKYVATTTLVLDAGDTDDDGDVDINDVTLFIGQFGSLAHAGGCPWDGTKDADFSNNGAVGSEDYASLTLNWLTTSAPLCAAGFGGGPFARERLRASIEVHDRATAQADLDGNGRVDADDVELLEQAYGLSGELSKRMRE
ncbi:MAG: HYR domain-containing protein [Planctomycetes bacterium]|nr:HYR domain-containing protein [Planctomycetota bacterium]